MPKVILNKTTKIKGKGLVLAGIEVDVTDAVEPGKNTVAIRVDHRRITELFLGGIVRPILLIDKAD